MTNHTPTVSLDERLSSPAIAVDGAKPTGFASTRRAIVDLTKPRITRLVTITGGVGFVMGAVARPGWFTWDLMVAAGGALAGTAMSAAGASALNQLLERDRDALMPRTCDRPLPRQRVTPLTALLVGVLLCLGGVGTLLATAGPAASAVSLTTIILYVLVYTPLKPVTTIATIIGAIPGALPPLIGWCAAATAADASLGPWDPLLQPGGWALFLLMFVWQIPHTLAIAWMYRDDYAKGGYRILPLADPDGARTSWTILIWAAVLIPATLSPALAMPGRLGIVYPAFAVLSGGLFLYLCAVFARDHTRAHARRAFIASIMHLPLLLIVMVGDAVVSALL